MAKAKIKLLGHLNLKTNDKKKIQEIELKEGKEYVLMDVLNDLNISLNEINLIFKNGEKVNLKSKVRNNDYIEILPIVGGG